METGSGRLLCDGGGRPGGVVQARLRWASSRASSSARRMFRWPLRQKHGAQERCVLFQPIQMPHPQPPLRQGRLGQKGGEGFLGKSEAGKQMLTTLAALQ